MNDLRHRFGAAGAASDGASLDDVPELDRLWRIGRRRRRIRRAAAGASVAIVLLVAGVAVAAGRSDDGRGDVRLAGSSRSTTTVLESSSGSIAACRALDRPIYPDGAVVPGDGAQTLRQRFFSFDAWWVSIHVGHDLDDSAVSAFVEALAERPEVASIEEVRTRDEAYGFLHEQGDPVDDMVDAFPLGDVPDSLVVRVDPSRQAALSAWVVGQPGEHGVTLRSRYDTFMLIVWIANAVDGPDPATAQVMGEVRADLRLVGEPWADDLASLIDDTEEHASEVRELVDEGSSTTNWEGPSPEDLPFATEARVQQIADGVRTATCSDQTEAGATGPTIEESGTTAAPGGSGS